MATKKKDGFGFTVDREALAQAAALVARVAAKMPPHNGVRLTLDAGELRLEATDLDVAISTTLAVAKAGTGAVLTTAERLARVTRSLRDGPVTVTVDGHVLRLTSGPSKATSPLMAVADFHETEPVADLRPVDAAMLRTALAQVIPAASLDPTRAGLFGVLFDPAPDGLWLVATDSYRLARRRIDCEWGEAAFMPTSALRELVRLPDDDKVMVGRTATAASFGLGPTTFTCRLIGAQAPNHAALIDRHKPVARMTADREELISVVKRVGELADAVKLDRGTARTLRWSLADGKMTIAATNADNGEGGDEVEVTWDAGPVELGFDPQYVLDCLEAIEGERAAMSFESPLQPVHFTADPADDLLTLVMPVRL